MIFRSEEHVERWVEQWGMRGAILTLEQTWQLAKAWHGPDRREVTWRRRTLEETEELLASIGLTGPFWNLRATTA